MEIYVILGGFRRQKTNPIQTQTNPISVSPQHCWGLKGYLKKQSQYAGLWPGILNTKLEIRAFEIFFGILLIKRKSERLYI